MKKRKMDIVFLSFFLLSVATFIAGLVLNRNGYRDVGLAMMSASVTIDVSLLLKIFFSIYWKEN